MRDRLTYWKCPHCHGTGYVFVTYVKGPLSCLDCDGTGNAMVNGEAERHKRRLNDAFTPPTDGGASSDGIDGGQS